MPLHVTPGRTSESFPEIVRQRGIFWAQALSIIKQPIHVLRWSMKVQRCHHRLCLQKPRSSEASHTPFLGRGSLPFI